MTIFDFSKPSPKKERDKMIGEIYHLACEAEKQGKKLIIKEEKEGKSHPQLKAIYKLFQLAQPHFKEWKPSVLWSLEQIKEFSKSELGFVREPNLFEISLMIKQSGFEPKDESEKKKMINFCKKIKQNISFADFTKEQAFNFAKEFEVWAQTPDKETKKDSWSDVYLTNEEKEAYLASLEKYYK